MYKKIRKKVASTVAGLEKSEDFAWGKWLKAPILEQHSVEEFETSLFDTDEYNSWLEKPANETEEFDFKETYILPEHQNLRPKKSKTHTVFFGLAKTQLTKLKLFDSEFNFDNKSKKIEFNNFGINLNEINVELPGSDIKSTHWELKPSISKIDLLTSELSIDKHSGKESKVEFKDVKAPPKIYKVKITSLDKIRLTKIYYLKNIGLHNVQISKGSLSLLGEPEINREELKYFVTEKIIKSEVEPEEPIISEKPVEETDTSFDKINEIIDKSIEERMSEIMPEGFLDEEMKEVEFPMEIIPEEEIEFVVPDEVTSVVEEENIVDEPEISEPEEPESEPVTGETEPEEPKAEVPENVEPEEEEYDSEETGKSDELDYEPELKSLYNYQKEGAKFLLENKYAVLCDEMGLGKSVQVITALKNHFANNKIKSAVIVCEMNEIGSPGKIPHDIDGWLGYFKQSAPELNAEPSKATSQARKKQWKNLPDIFVIPYDAFVSDLGEDVIDQNELKNICFVFDEVQELLELKKLNNEKFSKLFNAKHLWVLTSYQKEYIKEKLKKVFDGKLSDDNYLRRTRSEIKTDIPAITWQNKWMTLDSDQVDEYKQAFASAKEKVQWFLESGNPLRFNANVFTLIHQLKQVYNFSEKKGKSRKTKILMDQINIIAENKQKVVIFSQYEKAGVKKIEELLMQNNIKYLSYAPGLSTKDMESTLKKFSSSPSITALVAGVKPSRIKIPAANISYVIHFDVWWNPASLWQTEDALVNSSKNGEKLCLTVYSYLMKDTIEEKINSLLSSKGFLNKHVMETVNPDSITEMITNPEWLEIFNLPDEEFKQRYRKGLLEAEKRIDNYSNSELIERGKIFFAKLGYKNLEVLENKTESSFDIRGIYKKVKYDQQMCARFLMKNSVSEDEVKSNLANLKDITNNGKYFLVVKDSFEGKEIIKSNEALIDRNQLANYFYQFIIT